MSKTKTAIKVTEELLKSWANDSKGPVALRLKQRLLGVDADEGEPTIIYPPTYADLGYNIDTLSDGSKVALVDSVGSQANRMEPFFMFEDEGDALVPQITIELKDSGKAEAPPTISIMELAHRAADAVVQSCPTLLPAMEEAFATLHRTGNASPLCALAPTSLVFGVWDSRGSSGEKRPRLVRSIIRAWDIDELKSSSQFNSVWKRLSDTAKNELGKENKKLSEHGFKDAPASKKPGGVLVNGRIERDITVNLVALRALRGGNENESQTLREYLLGLTLLAATADIDLYLREGCHLRYADEDRWQAVPRRGQDLQDIDLSSEQALAQLRVFTLERCQHFRKNWPEQLVHQFDLKAAKKLVSKKKTKDED